MLYFHPQNDVLAILFEKAILDDTYNYINLSR